MNKFALSHLLIFCIAFLSLVAAYVLQPRLIDFGLPVNFLLSVVVVFCAYLSFGWAIVLALFFGFLSFWQPPPGTLFFASVLLPVIISLILRKTNLISWLGVGLGAIFADLIFRCVFAWAHVFEHPFLTMEAVLIDGVVAIGLFLLVEWSDVAMGSS